MDTIKFITVAEFKSTVNTLSIKVLKSPKTNKLFMVTDDNTCYRVQGDIDQSQEMKILIENDDVSNACLVNIKGGAEEQFTL